MRRCIPGSTGAWTRPSTYSKRWPLSLRAWLSPPERDRKFSTLAQQEAEIVLLRYQIGSQRSKIEVPAKSVCVTRGRPVDVLPRWCRRHVNKGTAFFDFYGIPEFGIMCKVLDVQADRTLSWTVEREREREDAWSHVQGWHGISLTTSCRRKCVLLLFLTIHLLFSN